MGKGECKPFTYIDHEVDTLIKNKAIENRGVPASSIDDLRDASFYRLIAAGGR
ncbi:hypothetical protein BCM02_103216 [Paenibacillus methanolicus]|uniref:Uncharacterized protein n=1 Tax=Paenibacillus methanolicus TaxID=582686 RepID=A0A5S5CB28_9BACL|nr:hypothetical protein BCM02_103216 [Paenibacillus methanolicus]